MGLRQLRLKKVHFCVCVCLCVRVHVHTHSIKV